ncbi:hypothetical protein B0A81_15340 [Flavobacterium plurextorum]|uniref:Glycosyltransferase 2-like domain-containing protein n=1 Tax=Flavobacterium plurextorum TaxID=1114867 RepID=A0ABX4CTA7_9FLAO|nr:glycosyltransferase family 2 protein [Flavobacterium plurextorum]OXB05322.1 hypothetical protein B0A81_15340 [Flavobacterium plurextorum]
MQVSIIIVNYNTLEITNNCIKSIKEHTQHVEYEIVLVDNGSSDGSVNFFSDVENIVFIKSPINLGFGRANNLGFEKAQGEFLFLLNSDTLLKENSIKKMLDFFVKKEKQLNIGSLGCVLIDQDGNFNGDGSVIPSCKTEIDNYKQNLPVLKFFLKKDKPVRTFINEGYYKIGYVIGADLMIRKTLFADLGGFDPIFFMYYEESDLQLRMKKKGYESYIYSETQIVHLEDASGKQIKKYSNKKRIIAHTSKNLFLKKNDSDNFKKYKLWDKFFICLSKFSRNYSLQEKKEFESEIRKTY